MTRVVLHNAAFRELRNSSEMQSAVGAAAEKVAKQAGDGYVVLGPTAGKRRARATVVPATIDAVLREARDHPLLAALHG